jgi:hypothetical protein
MEIIKKIENSQWGALVRGLSARWKKQGLGLALMASGLALSIGRAGADTPAPLLFQDFTQPTPWTKKIDSTGVWRIAGPWVGTGKNHLLPKLAAVVPAYPNDSGTGFLTLSMNPGPALQGSEIQSLPTSGYGYGYYETRMKVSPVKGGCVSFFLKEVRTNPPGYGKAEYDVEFLLNEPWLTDPNAGKVWYSVHGPGGDKSHGVSLPFNPTLGFHRYGLLWTPGALKWYVDGVLSYSVERPDLTSTRQLFIMANAWSGAKNWGGDPPSQVSTSYYDWIKYWPDVSAPPDAEGGTQ